MPRLSIQDVFNLARSVMEETAHAARDPEPSPALLYVSPADGHELMRIDPHIGGIGPYARPEGETPHPPGYLGDVFGMPACVDATQTPGAVRVTWRGWTRTFPLGEAE